MHMRIRIYVLRAYMHVEAYVYASHVTRIHLSGACVRASSLNNACVYTRVGIRIRV